LLYLHGSSANTSFAAGGGQQVCVTVDELEMMAGKAGGARP
jgi:hypothetical protein